ncbi:hypothetical protein ACMFMG_007094 [Clarireedia jacksonii]
MNGACMRKRAKIERDYRYPIEPPAAVAPSLPTFSQNLLSPSTFALAGASLHSTFLPHIPLVSSSPRLLRANLLTNHLTSTLAAPPLAATTSFSLSDTLPFHPSTHALNPSFILSLSTLLLICIILGAIPPFPP